MAVWGGLMMAVNSLTPNMPRFDTLQKNQHSTAYRARQLVRGHRQLCSQSCSEHLMTWAPLYISLEIQFLAESSCSSPGLAQEQQSRPSPGAAVLSQSTHVKLPPWYSLGFSFPSLARPDNSCSRTREHEWPHTYTCTCVTTLPSVWLWVNEILYQQYQ